MQLILVMKWLKASWMMSDALMNRSKLDQEYVLKCIIVFVQERQI